ncbi:MAG: hypothetical protein ACLPZM_05740 [Thermoplasmata archaeon]
MPLQRITYQFTTRLPVSSDRAYRWATDYRADDLELMGFRARRRVRVLAVDSVLLTDSFLSDPFGVKPGGRVVKVKLVHFLPRFKAWTSTHITGPTRHSQFLYEIVPTGRTTSMLHYTGIQVERVAHRSTALSRARRARELARIDSGSWKRLAVAKDLE